jgi:hypothetical protein
MKSVQEAMKYRGRYNAEYRQEYHTAKDSIDPRENLSRWIDKNIHRPHAADYHGCIKKGIDPGKISEEMVSYYSDSYPDHQNGCAYGSRQCYPAQISASGEQRLGAMLKQMPSLKFRSRCHIGNYMRLLKVDAMENTQPQPLSGGMPPGFS